MGSKEILTLQFGQYANYVGTHLWNIQETGFSYNANDPSEIDHDALYREGVTDKREITFTPRLLCVDLKDGIKALPAEGELYGGPTVPSASELNWSETAVEVVQQPKQPKSEFQEELAQNADGAVAGAYDFDGQTKVWTDFMLARFHPRTMNVVKEYQYGNVNTPFDVFPLGAELWRARQWEDEFADKIRNYVEECDHFQGFHMLTDCTDAFAGLSSSCLEYLRDEYERKSILVLPVIPAHFPDNDHSTEKERQDSLANDSIRVLNLALGFDAMNEHGSLFVPLCAAEKGFRKPGPKRSFYHTEYDHRLPYHSSAILAAAVDTFTLKHRLKAEGFSLVDLCADMSVAGRKCASASVCFPFSINRDADLIDCLDNWEGLLSKSVTPSCELGTDRMMQHVTLRGIPESRLKRPQNVAGKQRDLPAYKCNSVKEMLQLYYSCTLYATATNVTVVNKALPVKTPFPDIFDKVLDVGGNVTSFEQVSRPVEVPMLAGLHNGVKIGEMLESLHTEARKIKYKRFTGFAAGGVTPDDFEQCLDNLFTLRENYEENYYL